MEKIIEIGSWLLLHWEEILMAVGALLGAIIVILKMIPGEQGEGLLEKAKSFIEKFKKPKL